MTLSEAQNFWAIAHSYWTPYAAVFRYFARRPTDGHVYGCAINSPGSLSRTTDWADRNGYNSYWQPNPTYKRDGTRCSTADILEWRWFMVDVDPVAEHAVPDEATFAAAEWVQRKFGNEDVEVNAMWINSGRGRQLLYPLAMNEVEPMKASRAMAYWLNRMNRELKEAGQDFGCSIDTSCSDLPRVMRMPNTINQKTRWYSTGGGIMPPNADLHGDLISLVPEGTYKMPEPKAPIGTLKSWLSYLPHLTVRARKFLEVGEQETQRHYGAAACLLSLIEQGATEGQCLSALSHGAKLCLPPLPQGEVVDMVSRKFLTRPSQPAKVMST